MMKDLHKLAEIYRPWPSGTIPALLHVRSAGHYVTGPGWSDGYAKKEFLELFWCVRGEGEFRRDGKTVYSSLADAHVSTILAQGLDHVQE